MDISGCKTLKEVTILLYGKYHGRNKEKAKKYIESLGCSYKEWAESKKSNKNTKCLNCGKELKRGQYKFCSSSCSATFNNLKRGKKSVEEKEKISKSLYIRNNGTLEGYNGYKENDERRECKNCGKEIHSKLSEFCCNKCRREYNQNEYIKRWKNGDEDGMSGEYGLSKRIRKYLLDKANNKCECCGWSEINKYTNTIPLEIHHKDGNYKNNSEENLQVLCPNCHSLTETIKSHNKIGRSGRNKYSK